MDNFQSFFATLSKGRSSSASVSSSSGGPPPNAMDTSSSSATGEGGSGGRRGPSPTAADALSSSTSSSVAATGSGEEASGPVTGIEVNQVYFTFPTPSDELPHPQCTPIAFYNSDVPYGTGRLVAASDNYICYAIKDGHIRVINRQSVLRILLKGHKKPVIDLAFASRTTSVLASLGGDGSFFLWTIVEGPSRDPAKGGVMELTPVPFLSVQNINLQRVIWHPTKPNTIAVAQNGEVALLSTVNLIEKSGGNPAGIAGTPAPSITASSLADLLPDWRFNAHNMKVLDLSFSQDGQYIVTAGVDGWARVWDVESRNAVARWQPYGGEPLSRALFLHRKTGAPSGEKMFVVTGGKQDSEIKIWKAWKALAPINTQTLTFQDNDGKGRAFHLEADETGELLLLADSLRPLLYVAHVVMGPSNAKVDRLTPFQLKHPVLSLLSMQCVAMDAHEGQANRTGAAEVQLYCVQTQAIQIYHIKPEDCSGPVRKSSTSSQALVTPVSVGGEGKAGARADAAADEAVTAEKTATETSPSPPPTTSSTAKTSSPTPAAEQPAILRMLLQASQAAGGAKGETSSSFIAPRASPPPPTTTSAAALITPQDLTVNNNNNGPEERSTQSVASASSEEKQAVGAHTTEDRGSAGESSSSSTKSSGASSLSPASSKSLPPRTLMTRGGEGGGRSSSGQASRDAGAKASPIPSGRTLSPAPTPPPSLSSSSSSATVVRVTTTTAAAGGATGADSAAILAKLEAIEDRLGRLAREKSDTAERVSASTKQAVTEALSGIGPTLSTKVDKAVKSALEGVPAQLAGSIGEAVKEPVTSSFRQCFQDQLIPAIQTATQRMFAQMSEALNKNLAARGSGSGPGLAEVQVEVGEMRNQLNTLAGAIGTLSSQLENLGQKFDGLAIAGGEGNGVGLLGGSGSRSEPPSTPSTISLKESLKKLVPAGRFNEAFEQALGASDLALVTWLCAEAPRDDIFDVDPPLLSQTILLCLMQQLSFNLGKETGLKLEWLKQISLVFNPQDPEVASFVGDVLGQLQSNLETAGAEVVAVGDQESIKDFKFIQRAVARFNR